MKITQAILPVAGLGTRFLPWTKAVPKELLPIGNEPIIAHIVRECLDVGITDICFVISKGKESIPNYFITDEALEKELELRGKLHHLEELKRYDSVNFHTVYQEKQHGDGHAIIQAADWVKTDAIAVCFGDDLFVGEMTGLKQIGKTYKEGTAILALANVPKDETAKYGIVDVASEDSNNPRLKKIRSLVEKPDPKDAPSTLGIVGRYIIPKETLNVLEKFEASHTKEIRLIDALIEQLGSIDIFGYECEGTRLDTGTPEGYAKAVQLWNDQ